MLRQFPPVSLKRAVPHRKHVGGTSHCELQTCWLTTNMPGRQQTTAATSAERCSALQGLCKKISARACACGGFCNLWLQNAPHEAVQFQGWCECSVSFLQSLLREPLLIANMSVERAIAGSKHAGSPQTCQAASKPRLLPALSAALRAKDYARKCSELAWDCGGFCNLWLQNAPHEAVQFQGWCDCLRF